MAFNIYIYQFAESVKNINLMDVLFKKFSRHKKGKMFKKSTLEQRTKNEKRQKKIVFSFSVLAQVFLWFNKTLIVLDATMMLKQRRQRKYQDVIRVLKTLLTE